MDGNGPAGTSPFWDHPPTTEKSAKLPDNALYIREALKGFAETWTEDDWRLVGGIMIGILQVFNALKGSEISSLNEAHDLGWKMGWKLKGEDRL